MKKLLHPLLALPIGIAGLAGISAHSAPSGPEHATAEIQETEPASQEADPVQLGPDPQDWVEVDELDGVPVVTVRSYYESGKLRRIHTQMAAVEGPMGHHGRDLHLLENGVIHQEAHWRQGRLHGDYHEWFEGGQLKVRTQFVDNLRHGLFEEFGGQGVLRVRGHYNAGVLHGEFRLWFAGGDNQELSHWDQGVQTGLYRVWLQNNVALRAVHYDKGRLHGSAIEYHPLPDEERIQRQGEYLRGERHGTWKELDLEGRVVLLSTYQEGVLSGPYEQWKAGVSVLQTQYAKGLEQGERKEFYLDGKPFAQGVMKDGLREGPWQYWEEDGSLQTHWSGIYRAGKKVAEWGESSDE